MRDVGLHKSSLLPERQTIICKIPLAYLTTKTNNGLEELAVEISSSALSCLWLPAITVIFSCYMLHSIYGLPCIYDMVSLDVYHRYYLLLTD